MTQFEVERSRVSYTDDEKRAPFPGPICDSSHLYPMVLEVPVLEMLSRSLMSIMAAAAEVVVGGSTSLSLSLPPPPVLPLQRPPDPDCSAENGNLAWASALTAAGTAAEAAAADLR